MTESARRVRPQTNGIYTTLPGGDPPPSQVTIVTIYNPMGNTVPFTSVPTIFRVKGTVTPPGAYVTGRLWDPIANAWLPTGNGGGPINVQADTFGTWYIPFYLDLAGYTLPHSFSLKVWYNSSTDPASDTKTVTIVSGTFLPVPTHPRTAGNKTSKRRVGSRSGKKPEHAADKTA